MQDNEGKLKFAGSRLSCGRNAGVETTEAAVTGDGKSMISAGSISKTFSKGYTISVTFKQTVAGGVWGMGSTATNDHFYLRSNWGSCGLALGADNTGDNWFCVAKTACGMTTTLQKGQWYTAVGTFGTDQSAHIFLKRPGETSFCKVLDKQATKVKHLTSPVNSVYIGGDGMKIHIF